MNPSTPTPEQWEAECKRLNCIVAMPGPEYFVRVEPKNRWWEPKKEVKTVPITPPRTTVSAYR